MAFVSTGQAEDERYPAWPQDLITNPLVTVMDFSSSHPEIDLPFFTDDVYPILTSDRQRELLEQPSTMMADSVTGGSNGARESYASNYPLSMEEDPSESQRHFANLPEPPTWSTAELEPSVSQALSFPSQSL
jgi:hypothetical protein